MAAIYAFRNKPGDSTVYVMFNDADEVQKVIFGKLTMMSARRRQALASALLKSKTKESAVERMLMGWELHDVFESDQLSLSLD